MRIRNLAFLVAAGGLASLALSSCVNFPMPAQVHGSSASSAREFPLPVIRACGSEPAGSAGAVVCKSHPAELVAELPAASLAGHRLHIRIQGLDGIVGAQATFLLTSFDRRAIKAHLGISRTVRDPELDVSSYVPQGSERVVVTLQLQGVDAVVDLHARYDVSKRSFAEGELCEDCKAFLDECFERLESKFLFADRVDWRSLRRTALLNATGAQGVDELYPSMRDVMRRIGEPHSQFIDPLELEHVRRAMAQRMTGGALLEARMMEQGIAYLRLESFAGVDAVERARYTELLARAVDDLCASTPRGWILDLRRHGGGSIEPAITGLQPLIDAADAGFTVTRDGRRHAWSYGARPGGASPCHAGTRIAVLVGPSTKSAGEAVAIAFKGRPNARIFGARTGGFTTSVYDKPLRDGSILAVSWGYFADAQGRIYRNGVDPDETLVLTDCSERVCGTPEVSDWLQARR